MKIDVAEFIVNEKSVQKSVKKSVQKEVPEQEIPKKLYMAGECTQEFYEVNDELVNIEYADCAKISSCELIEQNKVIEGVRNTENISPPPYDGELFEETDESPEYSVPFIDPPEYTPNSQFSHIPEYLDKFVTSHYLPKLFTHF